MVVIDTEEVVEVTTNILGCLHRGVNIQFVAVFWERREHLRQDILLNVSGRH